MAAGSAPRRYIGRPPTGVSRLQMGVSSVGCPVRTRSSHLTRHAPSHAAPLRQPRHVAAVTVQGSVPTDMGRVAPGALKESATAGPAAPLVAPGAVGAGSDTNGGSVTNERIGGLRDWIRRAFLLDGTETNRLAAMEGMRGLSIILVFFVHFGGMIAPWTPENTITGQMAARLTWMGHTGVDLFFVLSGFLIYSALIRKPRPYRDFLARRVQRLYPAFLAVFAIYLALSFVFPEHGKIPSQFIPGATYVIVNLLLLPGLLPLEPMITVTWSLSYEIGFYTALPGIIGGLRLRKRDTLFRVFVVAALGALIVVAIPRVFRIAMFATGILLAELSPRYAGRNTGPLMDFVGGTAFLLVLPTAGVLLEQIWLHGARAPWAPTLYILVMSAAALPLCLGSFYGRGLLNRFFSLTPLRLLGNMSYTYYLIHGVTLMGFFLVFRRLVPATSVSAAWFWIALVPAFLTTAIVAGTLFVLIERRFSIVSTHTKVIA